MYGRRCESGTAIATRADGIVGGIGAFRPKSGACCCERPGHCCPSCIMPQMHGGCFIPSARAVRRIMAHMALHFDCAHGPVLAGSARGIASMATITIADRTRRIASNLAHRGTAVQLMARETRSSREIALQNRSR